MPWNVKPIAFQGQRTHRILQKVGNPSPLLALCNILLLKNDIRVNHNITGITFSDLKICLTDHLHKLFELKIERGRLNDAEMANEIQNVEDCINLFPILETEAALDINIRFSDVDHFEYNSAIAMFDNYDVHLLHGLVVDPQNNELHDILKDKSYHQIINQFMNKYNDSYEETINYTNDETNDENPATTQQSMIQQFLSDNSQQLTGYGLIRIYSIIPDNGLSILFRNNYYSVIYNHDGYIYELVTDETIINTNPNIVWQLLSRSLSIDDQQYFSDKFERIHINITPNDQYGSFNECILNGKPYRSMKPNRKLHKIHKIKQCDKDLVFGYINAIQSLLPNDNPYYLIPSDMKYMCTYYYLSRKEEEIDVKDWNGNWNLAKIIHHKLISDPMPTFPNISMYQRIHKDELSQLEGIYVHYLERSSVDEWIFIDYKTLCFCNGECKMPDINQHRLALPNTQSSKSFVVDVFHRQYKNKMNKPIRHIFHMNKNHKIYNLLDIIAQKYETDRKLLVVAHTANFKICKHYTRNYKLHKVPNNYPLQCFILTDWDKLLKEKKCNRNTNSKIWIWCVCHLMPCCEWNSKNEITKTAKNKIWPLFGMPFIISLSDITTQRKLYQIIYEYMYCWLGDELLKQPPKLRKTSKKTEKSKGRIGSDVLNKFLKFVETQRNKISKEETEEKEQMNVDVLNAVCTEYDIDQYESEWNNILLNELPFTLRTIPLRTDYRFNIDQLPDEIIMDNRVYRESINSNNCQIVIDWNKNMYDKVKGIINRVVKDEQYSNWRSNH